MVKIANNMFNMKGMKEMKKNIFIAIIICLSIIFLAIFTANKMIEKQKKEIDAALKRRQEQDFDDLILQSAACDDMLHNPLGVDDMLHNSSIDDMFHHTGFDDMLGF